MEDRLVSRAASGRFVLRIDPSLHARLRREARANRLSLNELCARRLATGSAAPPALGPLGSAVQRASQTYGEALVGVVAFGSWARGQTLDGSDVDLLIALRDSVLLAPALYRAWDSAPLAAGARRVEPHFVHLPSGADAASGLWAEVAIDGIVLYEVELQLSLLLVQIRRQIVAGRLVRRVMHGQPYWVHNEGGVTR